MLCCLVLYSHAVLLYRGKTQVVIARHTSLTIIHSSLVCDTLKPHPVERIAILCGSWYLHLVDSCIGGYSYADGTLWVLVLALEVYLLVVWVWLDTTPLDDIVSVVWVACVTWEISKVEWRWDVYIWLAAWMLLPCLGYLSVPIHCECQGVICMCVVYSCYSVCRTAWEICLLFYFQFVCFFKC